MDQYQEGCLSVPGFYENVDRPQKVRIKALDRDGKPYEMVAEGLLAVCIQHECDHLNGKLFVDYLSSLKRRSEEHTSELQSLMRISYADFCLKKKTKKHT